MENKYCFYKKERLLHKLPLEGIRYLESSDNDVKFHEWDGYYLARIPFKLVLDLLYDEKLVQVHRSYAVFPEHITVIGPDTIRMHTKKEIEIPVSKKYREKLMDHILILEVGANGCGSECDAVDSAQVDDVLRNISPDDERWERFQGPEEDEG